MKYKINSDYYYDSEKGEFFKNIDLDKADFINDNNK